jgi:hypothetical protein
MSRGLRARAAILSPWVGLFARILVPGSVAITLVALLTGGTWKIGSELLLIAPERAERGELVPVRAQLYVHLQRPEGPELAAVPVSLELRAAGRVIARGRLRPSHARTLDGALQLPADFAGSAVLRASVEHDGEAVQSERVVVVEDRVPARAAVQPRPLAPLQRFAARAITRTRPDVRPPSALALRIAGGACVPERTCSLLVHAGEPAASLRVLETPSVTPDAVSAQPSDSTAGVVVLRAVPHGPEAELRLAVERDGELIATRAYQLEIALGASSLAAQPGVLRTPASPEIALEDDEPGCIVDAFHELRWVRTGSLRDCRRGEPVPFPALGAGLWRLQVRRDPFGASGAAVATVYARGPDESDTDVLERLARAVLLAHPDDAFARGIASGGAHVDASGFETRARYLLAALDTGILALPEAVSGYPRAMARLEAARKRVRKLALLVLVLCAIMVGLLVLARGLSAAGVARRVMSEAGEEPGRLGRQRARMIVRVLAAVSSVLILFAAIAAYVVARSAMP